MTKQQIPLQPPRDAETERQLAIMREAMRRYRNALRELAKH
jgi:hypothetical protein